MWAIRCENKLQCPGWFLISLRDVPNCQQLVNNMNTIVLHTPLSSYQSLENNIFFQNELSLSIGIVAVQLEFVHFFPTIYLVHYIMNQATCKSSFFFFFPIMILGQKCILKHSKLLCQVRWKQ